MPMVNDATIYRDVTGKLSEAELKEVQTLVKAWANTMDGIKPMPNLKITLAACLAVIDTMGPAYCRVAASTLTHYANRKQGH